VGSGVTVVVGLNVNIPRRISYFFSAFIAGYIVDIFISPQHDSSSMKYSKRYDGFRRLFNARRLVYYV